MVQWSFINFFIPGLLLSLRFYYYYSFAIMIGLLLLKICYRILYVRLKIPWDFSKSIWIRWKNFWSSRATKKRWLKHASQGHVFNIVLRRVSEEFIRARCLQSKEYIHTYIHTRVFACVDVKGAGYDKELSFGGTNDEPTQLFSLLYHPFAQYVSQTAIHMMHSEKWNYYTLHDSCTIYTELFIYIGIKQTSVNRLTALLNKEPNENNSTILFRGGIKNYVG